MNNVKHVCSDLYCVLQYYVIVRESVQLSLGWNFQKNKSWNIILYASVIGQFIKTVFLINAYTWVHFLLRLRIALCY